MHNLNDNNIIFIDTTPKIGENDVYLRDDEDWQKDTDERDFS